MSEHLDQKIRSTVVELIESSPPPHPASEALRPLSRRMRPRTLSSGLVRMGAVALAVLLVGLAGAWIGRNLAPSVDVPVAEATLSPEPDFDPSTIGDEIPIGPPGGELRPEVSEQTLDGEVLAVGGIDGTDLEVFRWDTTAGETCLQVAGPRFRDTSCSSERHQVDDSFDLFDGPAPFVTTRTDEESGATEVIAVWHVPEGTSVLFMVVDEVGYWQRPMGDVAAFVFDSDSPRVGMDAFDIDQHSLAAASLSPRQTVDSLGPGETDIEGSPEDLVEIGDPHPVTQMINAGADTREALAEALQERGLNFSCSAGGVLPPSNYEICVIGVDGVLVVVPFGSEPGLTARIGDPGLQLDVVIPLDSTEPIGIRNISGGVTVRIEYFGEEVGSMSAPGLLDR